MLCFEPDVAGEGVVLASSSLDVANLVSGIQNLGIPSRALQGPLLRGVYFWQGISGSVGTRPQTDQGTGQDFLQNLEALFLTISRNFAFSIFRLSFRKVDLVHNDVITLYIITT